MARETVVAPASASWSLPEPEALDRQSAHEVDALITEHLWPLALRELHAAYRTTDGSPDSFLDIVEREVRLEALDRYAARLDAEFALAAAREGPLQKRVDLRVRETDGRTFAVADAVLWTSVLSPRFVHGPISLLHVVTLAEGILDRDERIATVAHASWRKLVRNDMRLCVRDAAAGLDATLAPNADITGSLITSTGRTLEFSAVQLPERPVTDVAGINPAAFDLVQGRFSTGPRTRRWTFALRAGLDERVRQQLDDGGARAAMTLADLLGIAMVNIRRGRGRQVLMAGLSDLVLPALLGDALRSGGAMEVRLVSGGKTTPRGVALVPLEYRFIPFQEQWGTAILAETDVAYYRLLRADAAG